MTGNRCSYCGCQTIAGETCRDFFDRCLALEFEQPGSFGAVHHLTVLCYMLQHNGYSSLGWMEARKLLGRFVDGGASLGEVMKEKRVRKKWEPGDSLLRKSVLPAIPSVPWSKNISEIRCETPEQYCGDVWMWARSILADIHQFEAQDTNHLEANECMG